MKTVSFVIPVRPGCHPVKALQHISSLNYPRELLEVILVEGKQPSKQRNVAVANAAGEVIYFLDDDSYLSPNALSEGLKYLSRPKVGAVGGPALTHSGAGFLESIFGEVVGSLFGTGITRSRNKAVGIARTVRGEELILCNLMMMKQVFLEMAGLDVNLYPNEENELFKRMRAVGYNFFYVPSMTVTRPKRSSILAFIAQMFSYGCGRGRHVLKRVAWRDLTFFAPSALCIYLLCLIPLHPILFLLPLFIYLCFIFMGAAVIGFRRRSIWALCAALPLFLLMHLAYGMGLMAGLMQYFRRGNGPSKEENQQSLGPAYGTT